MERFLHVHTFIGYIFTSYIFLIVNSEIIVVVKPVVLVCVHLINHVFMFQNVEEEDNFRHVVEEKFFVLYI